MNHRIGCPAIPAPGAMELPCTCQSPKVKVETNLTHTITIVLNEYERSRLQAKLRAAYMEHEGTNGGLLKDIHDAIAKEPR